MNNSRRPHSLRNIGEIYHLLGEPRRAVNLYQQALAISKKANDPKGEAETLNGMADVFLHLGENQKAMEFCSRALNLSRANDDRQGRSKVTQLYWQGTLRRFW